MERLKLFVVVIATFCIIQSIKSQDFVVIGSVDIGEIVQSIPVGQNIKVKSAEILSIWQREQLEFEKDVKKTIKIYQEKAKKATPNQNRDYDNLIKECEKLDDEHLKNYTEEFNSEIKALHEPILSLVRNMLKEEYHCDITLSNDTLNSMIISCKDYTSSIIYRNGGNNNYIDSYNNGYSIVDLYEQVRNLCLMKFYVSIRICDLKWETYYLSKKRKMLSYNNEQEIKNKIRTEVEDWQTKGEFESTSMWQDRVNEKTRTKYIESRKNYYIELYNTEIDELRKEQTQLMTEFQTIMDKIYQFKHERSIAIKTNELKNSEFNLRPYDADHETFLITNPIYGDILLEVPLSDAAGFKSNWSDVKKSIKPIFIPQGDEDILVQLVFYYNGKTYTYDNTTVATYALTEINYNFKPIDFKGIDISDFKIETSPIISMSTEQKTITSGKEIKSRTAEKISKVINASTRSNIDFDIPSTPINFNSSTFAVIIANENYDNVSDVPFAINDGQILNEYLINCVGLPQDHVKIYKNASFGNMAAALKHLENISEAFGSDLNLIFYYAGHGMPNEKTKNPMLIPVDGDASIPETCYDLDKLISSIAKYNARSVLLMLDACFSGTERGDGMLIAARGVRMKHNKTIPMGNMIIFSASQGDETAYPYDAEQHGLFTYFILKKLQENKGDVSLGELSDYVTDQVKRQSVVSNRKLQSPTVSVSSSLKDTWRDLKIR